MEMVLSNSFYDLTMDEMMSVDGGGIGGCLAAIGAGAIGVIAGPPAVITGTVAVVCWYAGSALIGVGGLLGALGQ